MLSLSKINFYGEALYLFLIQCVIVIFKFLRRHSRAKAYGASLLTSAGSSQTGCPKGNTTEVQVRFPEDQRPERQSS